MKTKLTTNDRDATSGAREALDALGWRALVLALALTLSLACVDGGDFAATGGMSGTGISQGSISAFGSVFVNGVEWEVDGSTIVVDGQSASETDLRVGMVVRVEGRRSANGLTGTATSVVFDDSVEGAIENIQDGSMAGTRTFDVFDVPVLIEDGFTHFDDGASFDGLVNGDVVEVSGFVDEQARIRATRVELKGSFVPGSFEAELKGTISALDTDNDTFFLGSVLVRYDEGTTVFEDLAGEADLSEGLFVEVKGILLQLDELDASVAGVGRIELEDGGIGDEDSDEVELEGVVSDVTSQTSFKVAGVQVNASNATLDPPGLQIVEGLHVEVEGSLSANLFTAEKVESEEEDDDNSARIQAAVEAFGTAPRSVVLLGVEVRADGDTELKDESDQDVENFRFEDIQIGDWLEIEGTEDGVASVLASKIERDDPRDDVMLRGPVTLFDMGVREFEILDQPVPIDAGTGYQDDLENPQDEDWFFSVDRLGAIVKAVDQDALSLDSLDEVDEVSLED